jgi:hypothetical protein
MGGVRLLLLLLLLLHRRGRRGGRGDMHAGGGEQGGVDVSG